MDELSKICSSCGEEKLIAEFNKDKNGKYGVRKVCRACQKIVSDKYYSSQKGKEMRFKQWLKTRYNLTLDEYNALVKKYDNKCAICKNPPAYYFKLYIDHNHDTGKVRGLLCSHCNCLLGMAKENVATLQEAINYLSQTDLQPEGSNQSVGSSYPAH